MSRALSLLVALAVAGINLTAAHAALPASRTIARNDITPGLAHVVRLRRADPNRVMTVSVSLALRNPAALDTFIRRVTDPGSRGYGHYLTPSQFSALYGPTSAEVQQVAAHLRANGLTVTSVSANRTLVSASGPVRAIERAFGVSISEWHDREQNRDFFGNDTQPLLPTGIAPFVVAVAGLNNHYPRHRASLRPGAASPRAAAGGYSPSDVRAAYDLSPLVGLGPPGSGQPVGLFELDSYSQLNITTYDTHYGLATVPPTAVPVDGGPSPNGGEAEVELDIELVHALAPSAPITVWEGPNTDDGALDTYNAMVVSDSTPSNSTSWGVCEPNTTAAQLTALHNVFQQAAAQGQSFFAASGDSGAFDCAADTHPSSGLAVDSPADDPYVTGVGGTALNLSAGGGYGSETAWSNAAKSPAQGGGGGLSSTFTKPAWQKGPGVANSYSTGMRQVPDVALDADPATGYSVYVTSNGSTGWATFGGTSAGAPAWAAFTSLANRYLNSQGRPNLGFANPALYRVGASMFANVPFHDVATGTNLYYAATAGWDYATGWGSFDAYHLAQDLAVVPPPAALPHQVSPPRPRATPPALPQSTHRPRSLAASQ